MTERIWDRFLTEADKEHLQGRHDRRDRRVGFGQKPALLLIDLYRAVFGDRPLPLMEGIVEWPSYCGMSGWNALPHIQKLIAGARAAKIPVIHITLLTDAGMPGWHEAIHRDSPAARDMSEAAIDRRRRSGEIVDEVKPLPGEVVLKKTAPSAFWGTPLAAQLTYLGVDTLIVAGESTSGCVRASVVEAASHRYRVQVVEECVFDRHEATHAMNLFDMHQKYADVIPLAQALAHLETRAAAPAREPALV